MFLGGSMFCIAQEKKWTLEECISYAITHNIQVKQTELEKEASTVRKQMAKGDFLPSVSFNGQHNWTIANSTLSEEIGTNAKTVQASSFGLNVAVDLYKGQVNQHRLVKARLDQLASEYQAQQMKENIALQVINSYLQVMFNKELVRTNEVQLTYDKDQSIRMQTLVDAGVVPAGDLLEAKATVAISSQRLITSENQLVMAKLNLAQLLQLESYSTFDVTDTNFEVKGEEILKHSPEEIKERAFESLMNVRIAQTNLAIAEQNVKIARTSFYPTLTGVYNLTTNANYLDRVTGYTIGSFPREIGYVEGSNAKVLAPSTVPMMGGASPFFDQLSDNLRSFVGLTLSVPIFTGFRTRNSLKLARLSKQQISNEKEVAILELEQQVFKAYTDTKNAHKSYEASVVTLESREKSLEYAKERYAVGLINVFDLNQNQNLYVAAQSDMLKSKYEYIFKTRILEYYFGVPLFSN
ncbi:TolC family protein [Myroides pelagicus]|nr:TolC family protein [Myroides pelagicus]MEC4112856.1 TolC family protein [Myroides pelagicus]